MAEQACFSAQGLTGISLWEMTAHAVCASPCHVYLNLDLLTIDPHAQDWGDFKIKPEQVEVQRNELTHAALFNPRLGFILQVQKAALATLMDMLRTANLVQLSSTIGKTWREVALGTATLDIYRDAKKQATFSAQDLIALKTAVTTK
jgi:phosphoribosylformylglycinamidine synthase